MSVHKIDIPGLDFDHCSVCGQYIPREKELKRLKQARDRAKSKKLGSELFALVNKYEKLIHNCKP